MILEMRPLTMVEAKKLSGDLEEKKELKSYFKKFSKVKEDKIKELCDKLRKLDNLKVKEADIVKVADFLPKTAEELNKIFNDVSLDEKEINDILDIVKEY